MILYYFFNGGILRSKIFKNWLKNRLDWVLTENFNSVTLNDLLIKFERHKFELEKSYIEKSHKSMWIEMIRIEMWWDLFAID